MKVELLDSYPAIAWDFDDTLIDHPNSRWMHQYILNHPEKIHVIVTFRSHGTQNNIFEEMKFLYPKSPNRSHFSDVFNISDRAWASFAQAQFKRHNGNLSGELTSSEEYYFNWKGLICRLRDIPVLIDDVYQVEYGCRKHGIKYIHPDWLEDNLTN